MQGLKLLEELFIIVTASQSVVCGSTHAALPVVPRSLSVSRCFLDVGAAAQDELYGYLLAKYIR